MRRTQPVLGDGESAEEHGVGVVAAAGLALHERQVVEHPQELGMIRAQRPLEDGESPPG
jgi:hypothetical protein